MKDSRLKQMCGQFRYNEQSINKIKMISKICIKVLQGFRFSSVESQQTVMRAQKILVVAKLPLRPTCKVSREGQTVYCQ